MFGEVFQRRQHLNKDIVLSSEQLGPSKLSQKFMGLNADVTRSFETYALHLHHLPSDGIKPLHILAKYVRYIKI